MKPWNRLCQLPWLNLFCSVLAGFFSFIILLGSQPSSPIARRVESGGISQWLVPIAILLVCFVVPACCVWIVRGFRNERNSFLRLDLKNFPRGRHSLEILFPRILVIFSMAFLGFAWFYAQISFFTEKSKYELFPEHAIQFAGGLVLVFALLQWTYIYLVRKTALRAGVSTAPVVGITKNGDGQTELLLADGTTRPLNLLYIPNWPAKNIGSRRIAIVLVTEPDGAELLVTKDGECFRKLS